LPSSKLPEAPAAICHTAVDDHCNSVAIEVDILQGCGKHLHFGAGQFTVAKNEARIIKQEDASTEQGIKPYVS